MAGAAGKISALISDVDGTLVRNDKSLPDANRSVVRALQAAGIAFGLVSSRPPRGLAAIVEALDGTRLIAGFNGGVIEAPGGEVLERHWLNPVLAHDAVGRLNAQGASVWVFSGQDWLIRDPDGPHVAHEMRTVGFGPKLVADFGAALDHVGKIVGVSEDPELLARCETYLQAHLPSGANVARSQTYYLDVTNAHANKGAAVRAMARHLGVPLEEVAVIGDGPNDVAMFEVAGFSIAMGNGEPAVRAAASHVTDSNEDDGFAKAIERFVLDQGRSAKGGLR
jgi:Cof subfamily protein (haloacid dehalogenase superfamily)